MTLKIDVNKKPLIILTGPTAVGKTKASLLLANELEGEIISADSMQVYRHMDIGTAKIKESEKMGITHHLIDIIEPDEEFNVIMFKELAKKTINGIYARGHIPIVVGGTGFYIQALVYDVEFGEYNDPERDRIRKELNEQLEKNGALYMHERLRSVDEKSAASIHMNNTKRMLNALEFYELTGKKISEHNEEQHDRSSPYDFMYFVLNDDRDRVYQRINERVDIMIKEGLVDEVKQLREHGYTQKCPSMLGLGYKEIDDYLNGVTGLDEAVEIIKRDTRHFAKKQLTWFRREKEVTFIERSGRSDEAIVKELVSLIGDHYQIK